MHIEHIQAAAFTRHRLLSLQNYIESHISTQNEKTHSFPIDFFGKFTEFHLFNKLQHLEKVRKCMAIHISDHMGREEEEWEMGGNGGR